MTLRHTSGPGTRLITLAGSTEFVISTHEAARGESDLAVVGIVESGVEVHFCEVE